MDKAKRSGTSLNAKNGQIKFKRASEKQVTQQQDLTVTPLFEDEISEIREYRRKSWLAYTELPLPTGNEDEWRRTSLKAIDFASYTLAGEVEGADLKIPKNLTDPIADNAHGGQVIVTPSTSEFQLEPMLSSKGVIFEDLLTASRKHPEIVRKLVARLNKEKLGKFGTLAGALEFNGIILYVPKNVKIESPLQSIYWAPGYGYVHALHVLVYLEEGASVTLVHESSSPEKQIHSSMQTSVMDIYVGPSADLTFVELQSWGEEVLNFTVENVEIERDGKVDWIFGAIGSRLTKNYSNLNLVGQGSTGKMSGFYFTDNNQHLDHKTQQNHLAPHTTSDLLFKGALTGKSRSVWQGMIFVHPSATRTDGYQANRNLILSPDARADSIPGLEILTDDVRCTHGATVGRLDEEQVFYLQSRGMTREIAERLIVEGFFNPIMQRIPFEGVKQRFQAAIKKKMKLID